MIGRIDLEEKRRVLILEYNEAGKGKKIQLALTQFKQESNNAETPKEIWCLSGSDRDEYLHNMEICQEYAVLNRRTIAERIIRNAFGTELNSLPFFETIHNYIDHESNIIRKGTVSAKLGEKLIIPINIRDGSLICIEKGNPEWNCSAEAKHETGSV